MKRKVVERDIQEEQAGKEAGWEILSFGKEIFI